MSDTSVIASSSVLGGTDLRVCKRAAALEAADPMRSCFLTTATVQTMGLPDDCEPLQLARLLRDEHMTSDSELAAVDLYYEVASTIVERSTESEWISFWKQHMRPITALTRAGEYDLAKRMYTVATARLINRKATRYADTDRVNSESYAFGLKDVGRAWLPYPVRYGVLKAALGVWLPVKSLGLRIERLRLRHIVSL